MQIVEANDVEWLARTHRIFTLARAGVMILAALGLAVGVGVGSDEPGPPLVVVREHKSAYVIYYDSRAPPSVAAAAVDLRDYIARATDATLPIVHTLPVPPSPFLGLGDMQAARDAGLSVAAMAPDAFALASRGRNIFIVGPDSDRNVKLETGGTSTGTANGVYTFLERYVDVRWLMPGESGVDVPKRAEIVIDPVDAREAPGFAYRRLEYIQNANGQVAQWERRQKLGYSLALYHGHNWEVIGPEVFDTHPEWFAVGKQRPKAGTPYKLETTNPALVQAFATKAIEAFRADPNLYSFSLSPSDNSGGWSESPQSKALYDTDPHGALSVTPLILKFYNDVARIVGREFPDRVLCGYVYDQYLYAPTAGIPPMEPNVCLVVAASIDYGYSWFRPEVRQDLSAIMKMWGGASSTTAYYDLASRLDQTVSAPTPASARILGSVFSSAASAGMKGIYLHGVRDWGYGAATNYTEAKLAWQPQADVFAITAEFYRRAYGAAAGGLMRQLNDRLEQALDRYYQSHPKANYTLTLDMLRGVYAASYPDIERSYLQALERASEPAARARLEMFGRNLILLRWNLRRDNLIPDAPSSIARTDAQLRQLLGDWANDLATAPETRAAALALLAPPTPAIATAPADRFPVR